MASGSIFLRKSLYQAEIFLTFFLIFTVFVLLELSNLDLFEQFYNLLWYYAMEIINDASWILVRVFLENLSILNIEAENFEAGDFLTIFLTFWGFWGSFSYKNSSYKKNVYSFISAKKIISLTRRYLPVSQLISFTTV